MLKNIPSIISPDLLCALSEMGHGDTLVIADGNFPSATMASNKLVRLDGHCAVDVLDAILKFFPLDTASKDVVSVMVSDDNSKIEIFDDYQRIIDKYENNIVFNKFDRNTFYNESKKAYVIVATSEVKLYANIILKKGCV
ncbi:MAG: RbsD/FucU family protein [Anaerorhabdus sp.]